MKEELTKISISSKVNFNIVVVINKITEKLINNINYLYKEYNIVIIDKTNSNIEKYFKNNNINIKNIFFCKNLKDCLIALVCEYTLFIDEEINIETNILNEVYNWFKLDTSMDVIVMNYGSDKESKCIFDKIKCVSIFDGIKENFHLKFYRTINFKRSYNQCEKLGITSNSYLNFLLVNNSFKIGNIFINDDNFLFNNEEFIELDEYVNLMNNYYYKFKNYENFGVIKELLCKYCLYELISKIEEGSNIYSDLDLHFSLKNIGDFFATNPLFYMLESPSFEKNELYYSYMTIKLNSNNKINYGPKIIVSLTSFPNRINTLHFVIENMINQTKKIDKIILVLSKIQFPNLEKELPDNLLSYKSLNLEIVWVDEDIKSHKKYFYTMQLYPNDLIITIDDDLIYDLDLVEKLYNGYRKFPNSIIATRTHLMKLENNEIKKYIEWEHCYSKLINVPSMLLFSTSGAGTLYPPKTLHLELFNMKNIMKYCINADDLWLKVMQMMNNTPTVLIEKQKSLNKIDGTQDVALYKDNVFNNFNDFQLYKILKEYNFYYGDNSSLVSNLLFEEKQIKNIIDNDISGSINKKNIVNVNEIKKETEKLKFEKNQLKVEKDKLAIQIVKVKNSKSYKIGRLITFIPRKISKIFIKK